MNKNKTTAVAETPQDASLKALNQIFTTDPWVHLNLIKQTIAPDLTKEEFLVYAARCRKIGVDPWAQESFPVLHSPDSKTERRVVYIDSQGLYNRLLRQTPGFKGVKCHAVYANDTFKMGSALPYPEHEYDETTDRGALIGAYAVIFIEGQEPYYLFCKWSEFRKKGNKAFMHEQYPEHMIKKIALMNAARKVCSALGNSYDKDEFSLHNGVIIDAPTMAAGFPMPELSEPTPAANIPAKPTEEPVNKPKAKPAKPGNLFEPANLPPVTTDNLYDNVILLTDTIKDALGEEERAKLLAGINIGDANDIVDVKTYNKVKAAFEKYMERSS